MTGIEQGICDKFSYGLASKLAQGYVFRTSVNLDFVDGMHLSVVLINNQLAEDLGEYDSIVHQI